MTYRPHPMRIQRKRTKGWRMPEGACCVTRPGPLGNPFVGPKALERFREWMTKTDAEFAPDDLRDKSMDRVDLCLHFYTIRRRLPQLRGKLLACFCPLDRPCHADVLAELANQ